MSDPRQVQQIARDARRAFVRYRGYSLAVFAAICAATLLSLFVMPRKYESEAKLFVRFGRENLVDPTASGQLVSLYESRESEVNSLLEILNSQALLRQVVEKLTPGYVLTGREPAIDASKTVADASIMANGLQSNTHTATDPGAKVTSSGKPDRDVQQAMLKLQKQIQVWTPKRTNVIAVRCDAASPDQAQRTVSTLIDTYLAEHVRVHQTAGSYEFFVTQEQLYRDQWQQAAATLQKLKDGMNIASIDGRRTQMQAQVQDIDGKLLANAAELATSAARIASLRTTLDSLPERIVTQTQETANVAADGMRQTLFTLEGRERELSAEFTGDHAELRTLREQLASMRQILATQGAQRTQSTEAVNPQRQALDLTLLQEKSQVDALHGREAALLAQQKQMHAEFRKLNADEVQVAQAQRDVSLAEARFGEYANKLEQARINRALDSERISSLSVLQPATYSAKALGPRKIIVLGLGFFVAAGAAISLALLLAYLNPELQTLEEIENTLEVPNLGSIWFAPAAPVVRAG